MKVARLTISDRASAGIYADKGGPELERVFCEVWPEPFQMISKIIADEREDISRVLAFLVDEEHCDLILTTGGTVCTEGCHSRGHLGCDPQGIARFWRGSTSDFLSPCADCHSFARDGRCAREVPHPESSRKSRGDSRMPATARPGDPGSPAPSL